jgi:hypothetical protein
MVAAMVIRKTTSDFSRQSCNICRTDKNGNPELTCIDYGLQLARDFNTTRYPAGMVIYILWNKLVRGTTDVYFIFMERSSFLFGSSGTAYALADQAGTLDAPSFQRANCIFYF